MKHQRLRRWGVGLEYLRHQEIHNVTVRTAKCAHESVVVGGGLQRERRKIEPRRPSLSLLHQTLDVFGCEIEP